MFLKPMITVLLLLQLMTEVRENLIFRRAQYWDTATPYHYVRIEPKGEHDVLVVGGEDTSVGMKPTEYHDPYRNLERWARKRWTMAEDVVYSWTGIVSAADL